MLKITNGMSSDDSQQLNFDDIDMTMDDFPDFGKVSSYPYVLVITNTAHFEPFFTVLTLN